MDIAYGKEPREFLGQSVGFENELIGQTNFPRQPIAANPSRVANIFRHQQVLRDVLEIHP
jgi:hypothetical protein